MARRIIHIEPTDAQWDAIDYIYQGGTPFLAHVTDEHREPTGSLYAERVEDDNIVQLFEIAPDGNYTYQELNGLNRGWTKYDEEGGGIDDEKGDDT